MKIMRALLLAAACLVGASAALAQQTPLSTYMTSLAPAGAVIGTERMFALQTGVWKTLTPYQILSGVSGDCTIASPPSIVCTKANGVAFAPSATTDTTNAANIGSGTLGLGRLALTTAFFYVGDGSSHPAGVAMSGDCTLASTGAVTCTKANGVTFAPSATTDTTNASNISSGTLAGARQSAANLAAGGNGGVTGVLPFANLPTGSIDTALGYWGTTALSATAMTNCSGALTYSTATHLFGCNAGAGSGNVINSGTPTVGQIGVWVDATHLQGVALSGLATIRVVKTQVFTASGTYTPSTGLQYAIIECVGGGGGGGGVSSGSTGLAMVGSGGNSGGYSRKYASAAAIGGSQIVTIGAAGAAGAGSTGGSTGGATSVGSLCIANGGPGGNAATGAVIPQLSSPAAAGTGDFAAAGNVGQHGNLILATSIFVPGGAGASSYFGGGAASSSMGNGSAANGNNAGNYGGGGSGGNATNFINTSVSGGNGSAGIAIVTEFTNQ